jgi:hypothetical protein
VEAIAGPQPNIVGSVDDLTAEDLLDQVYFDSDHERALYMFGIQNTVYRDCKVVNLTPQEGDRVEVTCVPYNAIVHSFDTAEMPEEGVGGSLPPVVPDLPVVGDLMVTGDPNNMLLLTVSWVPAFGAQSYVLQKSTDGVTWEALTTTPTTAHRFSVTAGNLYLRVAAVNVGAGAWSNWSGLVEETGITEVPWVGVSLVADWTGTSFDVEWTESPGAVSYVVKMYDRLNGTLLRTEPFATGPYTYNYSLAMATTDGAVQPSYYVAVRGVNPNGEFILGNLSVVNPAPEVPAGASSVLLAGTEYTLDWDDSVEADFDHFEVWATSDADFVAPDLIYTGTPSTCVLETAGTPRVKYWKIHVFDVWGNVTISPMQTVVV